MNKVELTLLEKAFEAEIAEALGEGGFGMIQSKSKVVQKMVEDELLQPCEKVLQGRFPVTLKGYRLTHLGRMMYCSTCKEEK